MHITKIADIKQNRMDLECHIPEAIGHSEFNHKKDAYMKYDEPNDRCIWSRT